MANSSTTVVDDDLSIYLTTFNCGRTPVDLDFFSAYLFSALTPTSLPPDVIVLCLQEIAPISYSFLGGSFLASYLTQLSSAVHRAAKNLHSGDNEGKIDYVDIAVKNIGMMAVMVFGKSEVAERIKWVESAATGVGAWEMGNKGAAGLRLGLESVGKKRDGEKEIVPLTFIAAHLAPMEWDWERRNADWKAINENLVFTHDKSLTASGSNLKSGDGLGETEPLLSSSTAEARDSSDPTQELHTIFHPPSHIFFAGDLNYRTSDTAPQPQEWRRWPADDVPMKKFQLLLRQDQLTREMEEGKTLHGLAEAPITFAPTYKYSKAAQKDARKILSSSKSSEEPQDGLDASSTTKSNNFSSSNNNGEEMSADDLVLLKHWRWARHRIPSWCDRILYLATSPPIVHAYTSLPVQPTSDHRPVSLHCSIPLQPPSLRWRNHQITGAVAKAAPDFKIRSDFEARRAAARRYEIIVGIAAYLGLTKEGLSILGTALGVVIGWVLLKIFLGVNN